MPWNSICDLCRSNRRQSCRQSSKSRSNICTQLVSPLLHRRNRLRRAMQRLPLTMRTNHTLNHSKFLQTIQPMNHSTTRLRECSISPPAGHSLTFISSALDNQTALSTSPPSTKNNLSGINSFEEWKQQQLLADLNSQCSALSRTGLFIRTIHRETRGRRGKRHCGIGGVFLESIQNVLAVDESPTIHIGHWVDQEGQASKELRQWLMRREDSRSQSRSAAHRLRSILVTRRIHAQSMQCQNLVTPDRLLEQYVGMNSCSGSSSNSVNQYAFSTLKLPILNFSQVFRRHSEFRLQTGA